MIVEITIRTKNNHRARRRKVKKHYDDTVPISRDANAKRLYTAIVHDDGKTICLGTFDRLIYAWNARKAYWRTKMSTVYDHGTV